jgi:hypothetical protein
MTITTDWQSVPGLLELVENEVNIETIRTNTTLPN